MTPEFMFAIINLFCLVETLEAQVSKLTKAGDILNGEIDINNKILADLYEYYQLKLATRTTETSLVSIAIAHLKLAEIDIESLEREHELSVERVYAALDNLSEEFDILRPLYEKAWSKLQEAISETPIHGHLTAGAVNSYDWDDFVSYNPDTAWEYDEHVRPLLHRIEDVEFIIDGTQRFLEDFDLPPF